MRREVTVERPHDQVDVTSEAAHSSAATDPAADPAGPEAPVGWVLPADSGSGSPGKASRGVLILAWLLAGVAMLLLVALTARRLGPSPSAFESGQAVGTIVGPLLLAGLAAIILVRARSGRWSSDAIRSPAFPIAIMVLSALALTRTLGPAAAPPEVDPRSALRISGPFHLVEVETGDAAFAQLSAQLDTNEAIRSSIVRRVEGEDGSLSALVIVDLAIPADVDFDEFAKGVADGAGVPTRIETIGGTQVVLLERTGASSAVWVEAPLSLSVYGPDQATTRAIVEAILAGP